MPDIIVNFPSGPRTFKTQEEAQKAIDAAGFEEDTPSSQTAPAAPTATAPNWLQQALDKVAATIKPTSNVDPRRPTDYAMNPVGAAGRELLSGAVSTIAHPVDNLPAIAGTAAAMAIPGGILARIVAGGVGQGLGSLLGRGDTPEQALVETGKGALLQGAGEAVPVAGAILKRGGQHAAMNAVAPSTRMLSDVVDPATGRNGLIPGQAAKIFREHILDVAPGTPGSLTQAKNLQRQIAVADMAKDAAIQRAPTSIAIDRDLHPDTFLRNAEQARTAGNPAAAADQIEQAKLNYDNRYEMVPGAATPAGIPAMRPMAASHYTPQEANAQIKGLDAELNRLYDKQNAARTTNKPLAPDFDAQALQSIRRELAQRLATAVPDTAPLSKYMHETIPYRDAVDAATAPRYHTSFPATLSDSVMRVIRGSQAHAARPMVALAKPMLATSGPKNALLLRLAAALEGQQER